MLNVVIALDRLNVSYSDLRSSYINVGLYIVRCLLGSLSIILCHGVVIERSCGTAQITRVLVVWRPNVNITYEHDSSTEVLSKGYCGLPIGDPNFDIL